MRTRPDIHPHAILGRDFTAFGTNVPGWDDEGITCPNSELKVVCLWGAINDDATTVVSPGWTPVTIN